MDKVLIQDKEYSLVRLKLKRWAMLEPLKKALDDAISINDPDKIFSCMVSIIEMALMPTPKDVPWEKLPWYEFLDIYNRVVQLNSPAIDFPILRERPKEDKKFPWEYEGRGWFFWLHLFAQNYGWTEEVISELDIDTALGAYQEISLADQLQKEWEWGLSEVTYSYDKVSKTSKAIPYARPEWMRPMIPKQPKKIRMMKAHLPVGNVIDVQAQEMERREKRKQSE